ncbi:MAG TPA: ATP-dependent Clp protease adaptor ClpS [Bacteroidota bacterium]
MSGESKPGTVVEPDLERLARLLPPYAVILHNDDHNTMDHVVVALVRSVPSLSPQDAVRIMLEAHNNGRAAVIVCPLEIAELYRDRLQSFGLTATIEKS